MKSSIRNSKGWALPIAVFLLTTIPLFAQNPLPLTKVTISGVLVDVIRPAQTPAIGTILVLPGWNFSRHDWSEKTDLQTKALAAGYCLVLPEMGKSVYATALFPETRADWKSYPQMTWIIDALIPTLQQSYQLLLPSQQNYLLGLSTGARGVALIAARTDTLFKAGAGLSGDYTQLAMPGDALMKGYYGDYNKFKRRWETVDNPCAQADRIKIPLYLGHGKLDKVVPSHQSTLFYIALLAAHPQGNYLLHMLPDAGHDYAYWGSETAAVLGFFRKHGQDK